ncbi:glycosyltransferase family 4 protein [Christiangramia sp. LLG6405-1]|uniref:glycosyltransferase family 4 protein n=1 Tax=Christiangramia sp. LLG6405-1 TaxID=3160832 RepID=UPI00386E3487
MKHIAVICNYKLDPYRIGGMDRFFVAYNRECIEKGFTVNWFFSGGVIFDFYIDLNIEICRKESVEECFLNYKARNKSKFEVVITHFVELCTPFFKMIKQYDDPMIVAVDHNPRPINGFPMKKRLKNKLKGKLYSKYIDLFIGVSNYTKQQILKDYGLKLSSKTEVIHNGIAFAEYIKRKNSNNGKFIVASHLRPSKGIQDLIKAVSLLKPEVKQEIEIDIFGEGPMEAELKCLVKKENLQKQFRFCGSSPDLPKLFQNYSYMLQPTYMECFSLSILESLAANVPVITTPVGGNLEVIENGGNGFVFETGNIQQLADTILKIIRGEIMIENSVNPIIENQYNLKTMVESHINLLLCT